MWHWHWADSLNVSLYKWVATLGATRGKERTTYGHTGKGCFAGSDLPQSDLSVHVGIDPPHQE